MASFNKIILMGNLTRDPQIRYLPSQMAVVDFGLAVNHKFKTKDGEEREDVLFIDCNAFGRQAEVINQYCTKGKPLLVEGRLKLDSWEDKQGGGKRSKHTVVIDNFQLLGGRRDDGDGGGEPSRSRGPDYRRPPSSAPAESPFPEETVFKDDDIPF